MKVFSKIKQFNEGKLVEYMEANAKALEETRTKVISLLEELQLAGIEDIKEEDLIGENADKYNEVGSLYFDFCKLILASTSFAHEAKMNKYISPNPEEPNGVKYVILEKKSANKWLIDVDGVVREIRRHKDGLFDLDKKTLYCM